MKNFLPLKRFRKPVSTPRPVKLEASKIFRKEDTYQVYISYDPIDKNDPYYVKKMEEAVRSLTENPPPEFILKRMRGIE